MSHTNDSNSNSNLPPTNPLGPEGGNGNISEMFPTALNASSTRIIRPDELIEPINPDRPHWVIWRGRPTGLLNEREVRRIDPLEVSEFCMTRVRNFTLASAYYAGLFDSRSVELVPFRNRSLEFHMGRIPGPVSSSGSAGDPIPVFSSPPMASASAQSTSASRTRSTGADTTHAQPSNTAGGTRDVIEVPDDSDEDQSCGTEKRKRDDPEEPRKKGKSLATTRIKRKPKIELVDFDEDQDDSNTPSKSYWPQASTSSASSRGRRLTRATASKAPPSSKASSSACSAPYNSAEEAFRRMGQQSKREFLEIWGPRGPPPVVAASDASTSSAALGPYLPPPSFFRAPDSYPSTMAPLSSAAAASSTAIPSTAATNIAAQSAAAPTAASSTATPSIAATNVAAQSAAAPTAASSTATPSTAATNTAAQSAATPTASSASVNAVATSSTTTNNAAQNPPPAPAQEETDYEISDMDESDMEAFDAIVNSIFRKRE